MMFRQSTGKTLQSAALRREIKKKQRFVGNGSTLAANLFGCIMMEARSRLGSLLFATERDIIIKWRPPRPPSVLPDETSAALVGVHNDALFAIESVVASSSNRPRPLSSRA